MSNLKSVRGEVSTANSSATPLSGAAVFTGTGEEVTDFSIITVFVDANVGGSLAMQFSSDNSNWDRQKVVPLDIEIGSGSVHTLEVVARYFRIVYTNGSSAQAHFRLQTLYHTAKSGFLTSSPDQVISKINDAQIVRVANDPFFDLSRGLYADKYSVHKFGASDDVPNGTFVDVWQYAATDATYNWPTTDETFRVASGGNINDASGGSGARTVQVQFLDANGDSQQEQLTLAGASASSVTSVVGRRFLRAWVDTTGTINSNNAGEIVFENSTSGLVVGSIALGKGQTEQSMFTVPSGFTAYLSRIAVDVAVGTNKDADVRMWQRQGAYTTSAPFGSKRLIRQWIALQGHEVIVFKSLLVIPALTDVWLEATGNGAATEVDIDYDMVLVKNEGPTSPQ